MRVLVVGGAGYIGGYLTDCLHNADFDLTVYDNLVYEDRYLKKVPFIYGDVRDREKLLKILAQHDIVIWLAAIVGDGACAVDPFLTQSINEDSVKWLVDNYNGRIIFTSTCSVYGINNDLIDETAQPHPLSVYASTKLAAEQYIISNASSYLIFRLGTLYGLSDEHSRVRLDLVVNVLTKRATLGEKIVIYGGDQWRPLLHVRDVAHAIIFGIDKKVTGVYNLSCANYTINEIAQQVKKTIPMAEIGYQEKKYEDLRNYRVSCSAYEEKGWHAKYALEQGISELHKVIKDNRIKDVEDPIYYNEYYLNKRYSPL